jgi:hypothetical protein
MTPCSPSSVNRRFGGTYHASVFRVEEISSARDQQASRCLPRGIISQKMILFATTAVKTSNPTLLEFNLLLSSPWMQFWFVTAVDKYLNSPTFLNHPLATFVMILPCILLARNYLCLLPNHQDWRKIQSYAQNLCQAIDLNYLRTQHEDWTMLTSIISESLWR